jgi:ATP-dependent DNA helicase DinG
MGADGIEDGQAAADVALFTTDPDTVVLDGTAPEPGGPEPGGPEPGGPEPGGPDPAGPEPAGPDTGVSGPGDGAGGTDLGPFGRQIRALLAWATTSATGDRAELDFEPHPRAWAAVSVSARECPGAYRCPSGTTCFAEWARTRAATADVVVVNTHLYATHVASGGAVLPEHDVLVLDEAHAVEDIMTAGLGIELTAGRLRAVALAARGLLGADDQALADAVAEAADSVDRTLRPLAGHRLLPADAGPGRTGGAADPRGADTAELGRVLALARGRVAAVAGAVQRQKAEQGSFDQADSGPGGGGADTSARRTRVLLAAGHLVDDLTALGITWPGWRAPVRAAGP